MVYSLVLQVGIPPLWERTVIGILAFLPRLIAAILILLVGWVLGRAVYRVVASVADRIELDRAVLNTPLGDVLGGTESAVSGAFGTLGKWFVYAIAILAASNALAIPILSRWIAVAVSYLPAFIAGLLVIVIGFVVADFIGDVISGTRAATETSYTTAFANGTRLFLYFIAIVIGLSTMGIDVSLLETFGTAIAWGLAAAIALGAGIALGWGGKDYVAENIERWMGTASYVAGDRAEYDMSGSGAAEADGGADDA